MYTGVTAKKNPELELFSMPTGGGGVTADSGPAPSCTYKAYHLQSTISEHIYGQRYKFSCSC